MAGAYDDQKHIAKRLITHAPTSTGLSVPGTAASNTVLLRIPLAAAIRLDGTMRIRLTTGGTAAGPSIAVGKSLAGTGAVSQIGTVTFGTNADGTPVSGTITATDYAANDEIVVTNLAGTAASTPVIIFSLGYVEVFQ